MITATAVAARVTVKRAVRGIENMGVILPA